MSNSETEAPTLLLQQDGGRLHVTFNRPERRNALNDVMLLELEQLITRLEDDRFYLVTGSAFGPHDLAHLDAHLPRDGSVRVHDVTSARAVINLCGPLARQVLGDDLNVVVL